MTEPETSAVETADSSSSMVALRTIVMIAFLVAIPLMAVFGTGLPSSLRTAMQGGTTHSHPLAAGEVAPSTNTTNTLAEPAAAGEKLLAPGERALPAPGGVGANGAGQRSGQPSPAAARAPRASIVGVRASDGLPRARITQVRAADDSQAAPAPPPTAPLWAPAPRTATSPQSRNTTVHYSTSGVRRRAAPPKPVAQNANQATWQATAFSPPIAETPAPASEPSASADDPFARGERRLRQYGATRYRLESWGDGGELFRCSANVALPDHPHGARHFEAVAGSPSQAVDRMLEQIEAWRAGQRQAFNARR